MTPEEFVRAYETALASQTWAHVEPLIHDDAYVTFSDGAVHAGKAAVRAAYEANFAAIEEEELRLSDVRWVRGGDDVAVYVFGFAWSGRIGGRDARGAGRGTAVIVRQGDAWRLLAEHLGPARSPAGG